MKSILVGREQCISMQMKSILASIIQKRWDKNLLSEGYSSVTCTDTHGTKSYPWILRCNVLELYSKTETELCRTEDLLMQHSL